MSSFVDNLKNLNEKGCQCLYTAGSGPQRQIRVFPASALKMVVIEDSLNNRRFNIRHFANHYARHNNQWDPYPTNLEAILENITVERGDDAGVRLMEALKTFDAERLKLLGRDDLYVNRIQPYLERVAAAEKLQKVAIVQELYTVLQEPKVMAFANRNPKFKETMMAKAEELRLLHYLEFPELSRHLAIALDAYGQTPKRLPSKNEVVMANFPKLPANLFIRAEMPTKPHSTPYEGILNGTTVWQKYRFEPEESLAQFLRAFSNNNWLKWPLGDGSVPTAIPEILHHLYSGKQNLYEALLNWTEGSKNLLICKTVEEYKNPPEAEIVMAHFATLPDGILVRIQAYDFLRCDWGILYPSRQTLYCHQLRCELSLLVFFDRFIDNNNDIRMFETRPTTLKEFLKNLYINKGTTSLFEHLKTKVNEADLTIDTPAEMISRFYSFNPVMDIPACAPDCSCGGALEEEASCDCHRCTVEDDLRSQITMLKGQFQSAIKRIQLLEERNE